MGNAQDPSAPPSPYQEWLAKQPAAPSGDMNAPSPPMDTPGLPVPGAQPAAAPPPTLPPTEQLTDAVARPQPDVGVPSALAPTMGKLGPPQHVSQDGYAAPVGFGGSPVAEAQDRAKRDAAENQGLKGDYARAVQEQKEATDAVSQVQRYQAADMAENMQHGQRELAEIAAKGKESALTHDRVLQQRDQQLQDAINTQKNMVFDPDQYVHNMNVGQKIFTAIAVGLSAMGSSRSIGGNGDNIALNMLKESIQHGVDQQKEAYRRAGVNIDMANNAYARARQAGMDDRDATTAARLASINEHKTAADVITARYEPDKIEANRKVLLANLDAEHVKAQQTFAQSSQAAAARAAADVFSTQQGVFNMGIAAENLQLRRDEMNVQHEDRQAAQLAKQKAAQGSNAGWIGVAPTQEQQNKAAELAGDERIMKRQIQEIVDFKKNYGHETVNREQLAMIQSTATQLQANYKNKIGLGAMSDSDAEFLKRIVNDPTDLFTSNDAQVAKFSHLSKQLAADTEDKMASYGLQRDRKYKGAEIIDERPKEGGK